MLVLDEENFPLLSAASSPAKPLSKRAAAAAATVRPASPDTPLHARAEESTPEASRSASPAPAAAAHAYAQPPSPTAADAADAVNGKPSAEVDAEAEKAPEDAAEPAAAGEAAAELAASAKAAAAEPEAADAAHEAAMAAEAAEASDKDVEQDAAPAPAPVPVPPVAAWGSKEKPAFLTASSGDASGTAAAPAPPADAPKRAVPITQVSCCMGLPVAGLCRYISKKFAESSNHLDAEVLDCLCGAWIMLPKPLMSMLGLCT